MSVFERTLKAVASSEVIAARDRRSADRALADELAEQKERDLRAYYAVSKFVDPAFDQFQRDAKKNGYWAEASGAYLRFIPILGSPDYLKTDQGEYLLPLSLCVFSLSLDLVTATAAAPSLVRCQWSRLGNPQAVRRVFKDVYPDPDRSSDGGFFSDDFEHYEVGHELPKPHYLPSRTATHTTLSEVVATGGAFVDAVLAEFMAYCVQTAEAESLQIARTPAKANSSNGAASSALREFWGGFCNGLFGRK